MDLSKEIDKAKKAVFKKAEQVKGTEIHGPDFNKEQDIQSLIESYKGMGFQASNLYGAVELIKEMRKNHATIYLAYTSGIISSGLRDIVRFLVEKKFVDVLVTTTGGIEEDLIKCLKPFVLGQFNADGKTLREKGINRIGNIFVPNDRYVRFEDWVNPVLEKIFKEQKKITPSELIKKLGKEINCKESVYYWAQKNNIPVFTPAPLDGSLGDMIYFFKQKHPNFELEVSEDLKKLIDFTLQQEKTGLIVLGAGTIKHAVCNANLFRDGADYAVYINAAQEFDGSDAGATPDEAVSWGKIKGKKEKDNVVKVYSDATLVFPLIVAGAFVEN